MGVDIRSTVKKAAAKNTTKQSTCVRQQKRGEVRTQIGSIGGNNDQRKEPPDAASQTSADAPKRVISTLQQSGRWSSGS